MPNYDWSRLNALQIGRYAEYYAKMEFASYGFEVYTSEVDDHGIDFVVKKGKSSFYEIQVKSIRGLNYIFFPKSKFDLRANLFAAVIIFLPMKMPQTYLLPALAWQSPDLLLVSHDYIGKKSKPEWGLNLSSKNLDILQKYNFDKTISTLL